MSRLVLLLAVFAASCDGPGILLGDVSVDITIDPGVEPDATDPCAEYTDTDGDTIPDSYEGYDDFDGDTIPNYLDHDSDGDGWSDAEEAGDDDLCTFPVNTDWGYGSDGNPVGDELPDFLDPDSDDDGLSDADERERGTDPRSEDTDGDGASDLVEVVVGSDPTDPTSIPSPDIVVLELPYMGFDHEYREYIVQNEYDSALDVNGVPEDEPDDPPGGAEYDATMFIKDITPIAGFPEPPIGFEHMDETYFYGVEPGTRLSFDVDFYNNTVPPMDGAQVFWAWIVFLGDGETEIGRRQVVVIVTTETLREL